MTYIRQIKLKGRWESWYLIVKLLTEANNSKNFSYDEQILGLYKKLGVTSIKPSNIF